MDNEDCEAEAELFYRVWAEIAQAETGALVTLELNLTDFDATGAAPQLRPR